MLKQKHGLSMQAWLFRAANLGIIEQAHARSLFAKMSARGWRRKEPVDFKGEERPRKLQQLTVRALAEGLLSPCTLLEQRLVRVCLFEGDQAGPDRMDEEVGGTDDSLVADPAGGLSPESSLLVGCHSPAVANGEDEAGCFATTEICGEVDEQVDVLRIRDQRNPEQTTIQGAVEHRSLMGGPNLVADMIRNHDLQVRQIGKKVQSRHVNEVDEDIGVRHDDPEWRFFHNARPAEWGSSSSRPASSMRLSMPSLSSPSINVNSVSLPREISSRR